MAPRWTLEVLRSGYGCAYEPTALRSARTDREDMLAGFTAPMAPMAPPAPPVYCPPDWATWGVRDAGWFQRSAEPTFAEPAARKVA
jgi:hypothetical protein